MANKPDPISNYIIHKWINLHQKTRNWKDNKNTIQVYVTYQRQTLDSKTQVESKNMEKDIPC